MPADRVPKPVSEWSDPRHRRGYAGERLAMVHLLRGGWQIEAHRFRLGHHDLDLVARRGNVVAFIEVKTRASAGFGKPEEGISRRKQAILTRVAQLWRTRHGRASDTYRFDVIAVEGDASNSTSPQVRHIEDAWRCVEK